MTDIFINYRGADSNYAARLLFEGLKPRFGRQVFFDEETIQPGEDYVLRLLRGVRESTVLLAVIGPQWLIERRIDDPNDWIRRELATAYACGVPVIPVFTDGAKPEDLEPLPSDIARLRRSQGMQLRRLRANEDIARISDEVARHVPARRRRAVALVLALVALLLVGVGAGLSFLVRGDEREPAATSSTTPVTTTSVIEPTTTTSAAPRTTTTTTTTRPPEPQELWAGTVNLDFERYQVSFALDWAPPQRTLGGDIGLCNEFACSPGFTIAGKAFAQWTGEGLPDRGECVDLLNKSVGQPTLPVRVGTKACLATEGKRIGRLEVTEIGGPGKIKLQVQVWDLPPR